MKKHTKVSLVYKTGLELEFMKKDALVLFKIIHALGFTLLVYMTPLSWENIYTNVNKDLDFLILFS